MKKRMTILIVLVIMLAVGGVTVFVISNVTMSPQDRIASAIARQNRIMARTMAWQTKMVSRNAKLQSDFPPVEYHYKGLRPWQALKIVRWVRESNTYFRAQFPIAQKSYRMLLLRPPKSEAKNGHSIQEAMDDYRKLSEDDPKTYPPDQADLEKLETAQIRSILTWAGSGSNVIGRMQLPIVKKAFSQYIF